MVARVSLESEFFNSYGERFVLRVAPARDVGVLLGDETDWEALEISEDALQADFILAENEWVWLSAAWRELTGRRLKKPLTACMDEIMKLLIAAGALEGGQREA